MANSNKTLEEWLGEKPFELSLCAGYFAFFVHTGFMKALEEKKLLPRQIYGTSAGAIIGACIASGMRSKDIEEVLLGTQKKHFWDPGIGFGILKGNKYHSILEKILPSRFEDLKIPLHIAAFDLFSMKPQVVTSGELIPAVRASSAFPGLFHPVKLQDRYFLDGGLGDELGTSQRKSDHRLLVNFIEGNPAFDFSRRKLLKEKAEAHFIILKNLPKAGVQKMHLGKEIIQQAYQQMRLTLEQPL